MYANRGNSETKTVDIDAILAAYEPHRFSRANRAVLRELARTEAALYAVQAVIDDLQRRSVRQAATGG
jgi:hypothetical protein